MTFWKQSSETFVLRGNRITCYSSYSNCPALPSLSVPTAPAPAQEAVSRALLMQNELGRETPSGRHGAGSGDGCRPLAFTTNITKELRCSFSFRSHPYSFPKATILGLNTLLQKKSLIQPGRGPCRASRWLQAKASPCHLGARVSTRVNQEWKRPSALQP